MKHSTIKPHEMKTIPFVWQGEDSLFDRLSEPFVQLVVQLDEVERPVAVRLHHRQGSVTKIRSRMHDIAHRTEIGVLEFSNYSGRIDREVAFALPREFGAIEAIEKLVVIEHDVSAESGIAFINARQEEIVIVAGAQPFGLAVTIPWTTPAFGFDPEYPLDRYKRRVMN